MTIDLMQVKAICTQPNVTAEYRIERCKWARSEYRKWVTERVRNNRKVR